MGSAGRANPPDIRRALRALTELLPKLECAAEACGRMNWGDPEQAVRYARAAVFGKLYDGFPLCEIEEAMAVKSHDTLILSCAYQVVSPVIRRQFEGRGRT